MSNDDILSPVQSNGVYVDSLPFFGGQFIWKANPNVVAKLEEVGSLLAHETINHSYMHCWRHKTPLIIAPPRSGSSAWTSSPGRALPCASERWKPSPRPNSSRAGARRVCTE